MASIQLGLRPSGEEHLMREIRPAGFVRLELHLTCGGCAYKLKHVVLARANHEETFECWGCRKQTGQILCTQSAEANYWVDLEVRGSFEYESYKITRDSVVWKAFAQRGDREEKVMFSTDGRGLYIMVDPVYFELFGVMPGRNESPHCRLLALEVDHVA